MKKIFNLYFTGDIPIEILSLAETVVQKKVSDLKQLKQQICYSSVVK